MMTGRWAVAVVMGLAMTAHAEPARFALLPSTATLYSAPLAGAAIPGGDAEPANDHPALDDVFRMQVVSERDGFVELATTEGPSDLEHCVPPWPEDAIQLHVWTRKEALRKVATRRVTHAYPDGTAITLSPGVPVGRPDDPPVGGESLYPVAFWYLRFSSVLPADAVGTFYQAAARDDVTASRDRGRKWSVKGGALRFGGALGLTIDLGFIGRIGASDLQRHGRDLLVTSSYTCATFRTAVKPSQLVAGPTTASGFGCGCGEGGRPPYQEVRTGARVRWPDGSIAGLVTGHPRVSERERREVGGLACYPHPIMREHHRPTLWAPTLCFEHRDLQAIPRN